MCCCVRGAPARACVCVCVCVLPLRLHPPPPPPPPLPTAQRVSRAVLCVCAGNGIQNMFYDDPRVLYVSLHRYCTRLETPRVTVSLLCRESPPPVSCTPHTRRRYDDGVFYPSTPDAGPHMVGKGRGAGFNVNIGWNDEGVTDAE